MNQLIEDVCAASAAYLANLIPELAKCSTEERFERLTVHFEAALLAFFDGLRGWPGEPSVN